MRGPLENILYVLVDDLTIIKSLLSREYLDVDYRLRFDRTKNGRFSGVNAVEFFVSLRRDYYKSVYPFKSLISERLERDLALPFEKREFRFTRFVWLERKIDGLKQVVLKLCY